MRRRKARELALRILYQMETNKENPKTALERYCKIFPYNDEVVRYAQSLIIGVTEHRGTIDGYIERASENWRLERISMVDRNVLRIAIFEMLFSNDVPQKVAIDEAIEIGKKYGNEESGDYINGILDRVLKDYHSQEDIQKRLTQKG
ncbi:MAG: transcription antitermination factor NusB [Syntrophorhabdaceae bacterium]|nr:transcription antitermination factor NusB [Syntrophorhabdaceae bacterium]